MRFIFCWDIQKIKHYPKARHVHEEQGSGHQYYGDFAHCNESLFLLDAWEQADTHQMFALFSRELCVLSAEIEHDQSTFFHCLERSLA